MKTVLHGSIRWGVAMVLLCGIAISTARAAEATAPEQVVRDFYQWYVEAMIAEKDVFEDSRAELQRFLTPRLLKQLDRERKGDGFSADPFLNAQDFDGAWAKNIKVAKPAIKADRATAEVQMTGPEMSTKTRVQLLQTGGEWKIDKVEGRD
ncbi:hypothetical protein BH20VER2_BH20VER2_10590 [soil metagenome]|nr:DUF3828 domain-containing protein [Chthoniobacterales bacterium]